MKRIMIFGAEEVAAREGVSRYTRLGRPNVLAATVITADMRRCRVAGIRDEKTHSHWLYALVFRNSFMSGWLELADCQPISLDDLKSEVLLRVPKSFELQGPGKVGRIIRWVKQARNFHEIHAALESYGDAHEWRKALAESEVSHEELN